ncbi:MAG: SCO family protein [Phycisphaerales bacterium]|nr:SCO family protein [Phycisphaerales bacterium]
MIPLLLAACATSSTPAYDMTGPLPTESLYHLDVDLVDQHGNDVGLDVHRGHPTIISMFYASCPMACPMLIEDAKAFEAELSPEAREGARVLLVSLDPDRDSPDVLAGVVRTHALDDARWTLTRAELSDVRLVAAALDVRFRPLPDGEMNHSSILIALDRDGVPRASVEGLRQDTSPLREVFE